MIIRVFLYWNWKEKKSSSVHRQSHEHRQIERNETKWNVTKFTETKRNGTKQNEMYTKTGREYNLAKRIYRNGSKQNMSKQTCLFKAHCKFMLGLGYSTNTIILKSNERKSYAWGLGVICTFRSSQFFERLSMHFGVDHIRASALTTADRRPPSWNRITDKNLSYLCYPL
jgi:hypothetical protein